MGPGMPPVTAAMVVVPIIAGVICFALPFHALIRHFWAACLSIVATAFFAGWGVAVFFGFPFAHVVLGLVSAGVAFPVAVAVGVPFYWLRSRQMNSSSSVRPPS